MKSQKKSQCNPGSGKSKAKCTVAVKEKKSQGQSKSADKKIPLHLTKSYQTDLSFALLNLAEKVKMIVDPKLGASFQAEMGNHIQRVVNPICHSSAKFAKQESLGRYTHSHPKVQLTYALLEMMKNLKSKVDSKLHSSLEDGFIPFVREIWSKGTQIPTIRTYFAGSDVVSTGGADILTVVDINAQDFTGMNELCQVFDEFRPLRGVLHWGPEVNVSLRNSTGIDYHATVVGYVDFVNGNPPGSRAAALAHDNSRQFHCTRQEEFPFEFDFAPDQNWQDSAVLTTNFGYLKFYSDTTLGCQSSQTFAHIFGWVDFQFRLG